MLKRAFDARVIPLVAYTDPDVPWAGATEGEAKAKGSKVGKGVSLGRPRPGLCHWAGTRV